ncbi:MAG: hypothetical protein ACRDOI_37990 [Trebonia sp.]
MYAEEYLTRERHKERLRQARDARAAHQVAELRKLERRRERAERELLYTRRRVEQLRSLLGAR